MGGARKKVARLNFVKMNQRGETEFNHVRKNAQKV